MTARPVEIELKYLVPDDATSAWLLAAPEFGPFSAGPASAAVRHEDRYLDTEDAALARAGYAGRLRRTPSGTIVTLKSTATAEGALHRREELEAETVASLDPRDWPASTPRSRILELCGDRALVELVTIRQVRTRRLLTGDDTEVELSLDEVDVVAAGEVVDRFTEVEAELRSGDEAALAGLAEVLEARGLVAAGGSKLERARRAVDRRARTGQPGTVRGEGPAR
jgi:inorganic triphosphatase YgiF